MTATLLQMADGDVRCGSCGIVFNALPTLVDDCTPVAPVSGRSATREPPPGPQSIAVTPDPDPAEALEFDAPEDEWQRYFIMESPPAPGRAVPADLPSRAADAGDAPELPIGPFETDDRGPPDAQDEWAATSADDEPPRTVEEETADTDTWRAFLLEAEAEAAGSDVTPGDEEDDAEPILVLSDDDDSQAAEVLLVGTPEPDWTEPVAADPPPAEEPDLAAPGAAPGATHPRAGAQASAPDGAPDAASPPAPESRPTVLDWAPVFPERSEPRPPAHTARWLLLSLLAALALGAQAVHHSRDALAARPAYGAPVRETYRRLGLPLYPEWPLSSYEIRDAKAIAENSAPGTLDIVAEIAVIGPHAVGLPTLRVVLRDRWSNVVASGTFGASSYLAEAAPAGALYEPGSLIPVQIRLQDPGADAQGYELDVCMPNRRLGLQCKSARDPFRP